MGKRIEMLNALQVAEAKYVELRSKGSGALLGNQLADGAGLFLFITPNNSKSWRFQYRCDGRRRVLVYGSYPDLSLKEARMAHAKARLQLAKGLDPADERKKDEQGRKRAAEQTRDQNKNIFRNAAADWLKAELKAKPKSEVWKANIERWIGWANDDFGSRPLPDIEASDVLSLITKIAEDTPASAEFCRQVVSRVYRYSIRTLRVARGLNPAEACKGAVIVPAKKHRPKLDANQIPAFLADLNRYQGPESVKIGIQILMHCFTRKEELASAPWTEIDLDGALWSVKAARMKMKRDHVIPLTPQAVSLFRRLRELAGESSFVFPSRQRNKPNQPMGGATFNYALNTLGYKGKFGPHGVRSTAASILADAGWDERIIDAQLAHAKQGRDAAYFRNSYLEKRRELLSAWSSMLDSYAAGGAKVVAIGAGKAA
jgi:integrase